MEETGISDFYEERNLQRRVQSKVKTSVSIEDIDIEVKSQIALKVEYASIESRFIAYVFDFFILSIILFLLYKLFLNMNWINSEFSSKNLIAFFVWTLYYGLAESSNIQATFGKKIMGIKVIDSLGNRLTFKKATLRYVAQIISILPLGFGIWSIAGDEKKQAWHDMLLDCYVIINKSKLPKTLDEDFLSKVTNRE